jgi:hypothetical protein
MPSDPAAPVTGLALPADNPAPPPPMPTATPVATGQAASTLPGPVAADDPTSSGFWEVDPDHLGKFVEKINQVRDKLRDVQRQIDLMQGDAYTTKLGNSPVAVQLERKFHDRLDASLDNPEHPTSGGLRPMLAESMRRMEAFLDGADAAARAYRDLDDTTRAVFGHTGD